LVGQAEFHAQTVLAAGQVVVDGALVDSHEPGDPRGGVAQQVAQDDHLELPVRQLRDRLVQAGRGLHPLQPVLRRGQGLGDGAVDDVKAGARPSDSRRSRTARRTIAHAPCSTWPALSSSGQLAWISRKTSCMTSSAAARVPKWTSAYAWKASWCAR